MDFIDLIFYIHNNYCSSFIGFGDDYVCAVAQFFQINSFNFR